MRANRAALVILCVLCGWMAVISSCNRGPETYEPPKAEVFAPPVVEPLKFTPWQKIGLDSIKSKPVHPEVKPFDMNKLPVTLYDTDAYKPEKYISTEQKLDFNSLPSKDLDIDKLPAKPLKFKTFALIPPKLIKAGPRRLFNGKMSVYEFGAAQGLKADTISAVYTDRDGFEWIGTDKGLYRYDGENFWWFGDLPDKRIPLCIVQDSAGQIWTTTYRGQIQVIDIKKGIVKLVDKNGGLSDRDTYKILIDDQQRIWVSTFTKGINIIDPKTQTVRWFNEKGHSTDRYTAYMTKDAKHNIWIATTGEGLTYIDLKNKKVRYLDSVHGLKDNNINSILCDHKGRLWVALSPGFVNVFDPQKNSLQTLHDEQGFLNRVFDLIEDKQGRIWVGRTGNGVEILDPEKQTRFYLRNSDDVGSKYILQMNQDNKGQMWIAELGKLDIIETDQVVLEHIGNTATTAIAEDYNGLVWREGDFDGIDIIDRQKKTIRKLNSKNWFSTDTMGLIQEDQGRMMITDAAKLYMIDSLRRTVTIFDKKHGFVNAPRSFVFDKKGKLWIGGGSAESIMQIYDPVSNSAIYLGKKENIRDGDIEAMCVDKTGNVWISTFTKGIGVIDPVSGHIRYLENGVFNGTDQRIFLADNAGNIWVTGSAGLSEIDPAKSTLTFFTAKQGLIDKNVNSILEHNGRIYAGTVKGTTLITPPGTNKNHTWQFERFGGFLGLDKKVGDPQSDLVTRDGLYWMGDVGITAFNFNAYDTTHYNAYITGINIMDNYRFFTGESPAKRNGTDWNGVKGPLNMPVELHVSYDQNFMQFNYSSINTARHDTVSYKYKLIGADKDWSEPTNLTFTHYYINLSPADYTFEVSRKNYDGTWSQPAILSFTINPPWWRTWWAYVLYVVLLGGSIWGFSHYRSLQLIKEKRVLEHKVHIRTEEVLQQKEEIEAQRDDLEKAFVDLKNTQTQLVQSEKMASLGELTAGIAHEIQNPLNFVNNFSDVNREMLEELKAESLKPKDKRDEQLETELINDLIENEQKINHHGKRADFIVKGMLQHSRTSTGEKQPTNINTLADEFFKLSYHGLRAKDKSFNAELVTNFDPQLPKANVVQQDIGRVLLNLFNNAFYAVNQKSKTDIPGYKPEVSVSTSLENGHVVIKVKDNGTGIADAVKEKIMQPFFTTKPTGEGTGLGLSLTYDMVVKGHGGSINVDTREGEFTEFSVTLPLN